MRAKKRNLIFDAVTSPTVSSAIDVSLFNSITVAHSTIAASNQVVKVQGAIANPDIKTPPAFGSAKAVGNEWDYIESHDLNDTSSAITGDTGVTFAGADVRQFAVNTEAIDWLSFQITTGTAGALTTKLLATQV